MKGKLIKANTKDFGLSDLYLHLYLLHAMKIYICIIQ